MSSSQEGSPTRGTGVPEGQALTPVAAQGYARAAPHPRPEGWRGAQETGEAAAASSLAAASAAAAGGEGKAPSSAQPSGLGGMSWTDRVRKDVFIPHRDCELLRDSASNVVGGVDAKSSVEVALSASWLVDTATLVMKKRERTASLHRGPHESTKDRVRDAVLRVESTWSPMLVSELVVSDAVDETLSSEHGTFDVDNFFQGKRDEEIAELMTAGSAKYPTTLEGVDVDERRLTFFPVLRDKTATAPSGCCVLPVIDNAFRYCFRELSGGEKCEPAAITRLVWFARGDEGDAVEMLRSKFLESVGDNGGVGGAHGGQGPASSSSSPPTLPELASRMLRLVNTLRLVVDLVHRSNAGALRNVLPLSIEYAEAVEQEAKKLVKHFAASTVFDASGNGDELGKLVDFLAVSAQACGIATGQLEKLGSGDVEAGATGPAGGGASTTKQSMTKKQKQAAKAEKQAAKLQSRQPIYKTKACLTIASVFLLKAHGLVDKSLRAAGASGEGGEKAGGNGVGAAAAAAPFSSSSPSSGAGGGAGGDDPFECDGFSSDDSELLSRLLSVNLCLLAIIKSKLPGNAQDVYGTAPLELMREGVGVVVRLLELRLPGALVDQPAPYLLCLRAREDFQTRGNENKAKRCLVELLVGLRRSLTKLEEKPFFKVVIKDEDEEEEEEKKKEEEEEEEKEGGGGELQ